VQRRWIVFAGISLITTLVVISVFVLISKEKTTLLYNRVNGDLIRLHSDGLEIIYSKNHYPLVYNVKENGNLIEGEFYDFNNKYFTPNYIFQIFERNQTDGYNLKYYFIEDPGNSNRNWTIADHRKAMQDKFSSLDENSIRTDHALLAVQDESALTIIKSINEDNINQAKSELKTYLAKYPDDLFGSIVQLDIYAREGDQQKLSEGLDKFQSTFPSNGIDLIDYVSLVHSNTLNAMEFHQESHHAQSRLKQLRKRQEPYTWDDLEYVYLDYEKVPNFYELDSSVLFSQNHYSIPNFLHTQILCKLIAVKSDFLMLSGESREAEQELLKVLYYSIGLTGSSNILIGRVIGIAISSIAVNRLEHVYLSGYQRANELVDPFHRFNQQLMEYNKAVYADIIYYHPASEYLNSYNQENQLQATIRAKISLARMVNLQAAISLRHYYLKYEEWPQIPITGELLDQPGMDAFSSDHSPHKLVEHENDLIVYSVGPDQKDDRAKMNYDPTNGIISSGDIFLQVRSEREFPFPDKPTRYRTRNELYVAYPNGLPDDPFADTKHMSYTISDTIPPVVWSFGPDADQGTGYDLYEEFDKPQTNFGTARLPNGKWKKIKNVAEEPVYDPSNGTISNGNLYLNF